MTISMREQLTRIFGRRHKLPVLLQTEAAECGLACVAMILNYWGDETSLAELRQQFSISLKGTNLAQIMTIAEAQQLSCRALRIELEALAQLPTPCVLHWDMNHFVVLERASATEITIHDPASGVRRFTYPEASKHVTGEALALSP